MAQNVMENFWLKYNPLVFFYLLSSAIMHSRYTRVKNNNIKYCYENIVFSVLKTSTIKYRGYLKFY